MAIQVLSPTVVDHIAAGQVVERPAHLLKELLENSLDAGADEIQVELEEGGRSLCVMDNGQGVDPGDFHRVFERHATSKISKELDLWNLSTFGFRGEALASISSVSHVDFSSRISGLQQGRRLVSKFGQIGSVLSTPCAPGTQVRVKGLFANTPARLKFLRSDQAEVSQVKNVIKALALAHPEVSWRVKHRGELLYFWKKTNSFLQRAKTVLEVETLYENTKSLHGFKAHVVFSDPAQVTRTCRHVWIFVQNRWVQDRSLQASVMQSYRNLLMHGQYPYCCIFLEGPKDQVDINIHPTKSQVQWAQPQKVFQVVHHCLREALERAPWVEKNSNNDTSNSEISNETHSRLSSLETQSRRGAESYPQKNLSFDDPSFSKVQFQKKVFPPAGQQSRLSALDRGLQLDSQGGGFREQEEVVEPVGLGVGSNRVEDKSLIMGTKSSSFQLGYWSRLQVIGQVNLIYILAQSDKGLVLVDQHAAHERVVFEKLMLSWKKGRVEEQVFLLPLTVDLGEAEVESLIQESKHLATMGVKIDRAGPSSLVIESAPSIIKEQGLVVALENMAQQRLQQGGSFSMEMTMGDIFATMACHSVVRAGQSLSVEQMEQLLKDMDEFPLSGFCPHGRSVALDWSFSYLEKEFGRRG